MCGLAGYAGVRDPNKRLALVRALGSGIDARGGDAAGFVSLRDTLQMSKRIGTWNTANSRFLRAAAEGHVTMMHSRLTTCGDPRAFSHAHPYAIRRNGETVLWGCHNGMIYDARDSAKEHGRPFTVDSRELFELIADDDFAGLQSLHGYGVAMWVEAKAKDVVNLVRLSSSSEIVVSRLKNDDGLAWASTPKILTRAVWTSGMREDVTYDLGEIGRVYQIRESGITISNREGYKVSSGWAASSYFGVDNDEYDKWWEDHTMQDKDERPWWERTPSADSAEGKWWEKYNED